MKSGNSRSIVAARSLGISILLALGLAMPLACGGGGSSSSSGSHGGAAGSGAGAGGSGTGGSATGGSGTGGSGTGGSATGGSGMGGSGVGGAIDAGQDSSATDAGSDACQPTNGGVEICDGVDDDCNGKTDDHVAVLDAGPGVYTGDPCNACNAVWECPGKFAGGQPTCVQLGDGGAMTEVCDGIDNNCNGQTDEGLTPKACDVPKTSGLYYNNVDPSDPQYEKASHCAKGTSTCTKTSAGWGPCQNYTGPTTKACDGYDDDCDGKVDDLPVPKCPLSPSGYYCSSATATPTQISPPAEVCTHSPSGFVCNYAPAVYFYLDADMDGYPQPIAGLATIGPRVYNYKYGPYCDPNTYPKAISGPSIPTGVNVHWITSNYDWADSAQRSADPVYAKLLATLGTNPPTNGGFDCCDADPRAYPDEPTYYQGKASGGDKPISSTCMNHVNPPPSGWDFDCNGSENRLAADPATPSIPWNQVAACLKNHQIGWNNLYQIPKTCSDVQGHWIQRWGAACPGIQASLVGFGPRCK